VREHFGAHITAVLDGGHCDGQPSTVISLTGPEPRCLREGVLDFAELSVLTAGS